MFRFYLGNFFKLLGVAFSLVAFLIIMGANNEICQVPNPETQCFGYNVRCHDNWFQLCKNEFWTNLRSCTAGCSQDGMMCQEQARCHCDDNYFDGVTGCSQCADGMKCAVTSIPSEGDGLCTQSCQEDSNCPDGCCVTTGQDTKVCLPIEYCDGSDYDESCYSSSCRLGLICSGPIPFKCRQGCENPSVFSNGVCPKDMWCYENMMPSNGPMGYCGN